MILENFGLTSCFPNAFGWSFPWAQHTCKWCGLCDSPAFGHSQCDYSQKFKTSSCVIKLPSSMRWQDYGYSYCHQLYSWTQWLSESHSFFLKPKSSLFKALNMSYPCVFAWITSVSKLLLINTNQATGSQSHMLNWHMQYNIQSENKGGKGLQMRQMSSVWQF